jgi:hypothetical protein
LVQPRTAFGKLAAALTVTGLFLTSLYAISGRHQHLKASVADQIALHEFFKDQPPRIIYADVSTTGHLHFYAGFQNTGLLRMLDGLNDCSMIRDAYVVVNSTRGWIEHEPFLDYLPPCVKDIPPTWKLVRRIRAATLEVYERFDPTV